MGTRLTIESNVKTSTTKLPLDTRDAFKLVHNPLVSFQQVQLRLHRHTT